MRNFSIKLAIAIAMMFATGLATVPAQAEINLAPENTVYNEVREVYIPLSTLCSDIWDGYIGADGVRYCKAHCQFDSRSRECNFNPSGCPDAPNSFLGSDGRCHCKAGLNWNRYENMCVAPKKPCGDNAFLNDDGECQCRMDYKWVSDGGDDCERTEGPKPRKTRTRRYFFQWQ